MPLKDGAEQLVEVFTLLQDLWREAFGARRSSAPIEKVANEEHEDTYGEQADLAADAIGKAIRNPSQIIKQTRNNLFRCLFND
ncbi:hypothetical protein FIBSPDRAFT_964873 [Athelia psychrophila]|uniref:Uncharacterized protein n=1 Tax=Athelia psychrophila TaxID=1759441 RepID=A0A165X8P8_9AGAM|nr:hypothetical protein FIBSPDRAFT_964873 [Fibularhizoctonia sp. CBS 109695]